MAEAINDIAPNERIRSIDQFRGYAVVGMILVNFVGPLTVFPSVFKHNDNYLSYADTILTIFLFIVGMSFRLTMLRRLRQMNWPDACASYNWSNSDSDFHFDFHFRLGRESIRLVDLG